MNSFKMKTLCLCISVFTGFFIIYTGRNLLVPLPDHNFVRVRGSSAQWFEDPSLTFQNITFDMANRASYNTSDCLFDLLQCWEAVKPDMICSYLRWYSSICGVMRDYCAEGYGDQTNYNHIYNIAQGFCATGQQYWT